MVCILPKLCSTPPTATNALRTSHPHILFVPLLLWCLIFILEYVAEPQGVCPHPRIHQCVGAAHQEGSRSQNIQISQTCDRHTPSTKVIQTSLLITRNDILRGSTLAARSIPQRGSAHPELVAITIAWLSTS